MSVYLIKDEYSDHKDILKDLGKLKTAPIDDIGTFYYGDSHTFKPLWVEKFFGSSLGDISELFNASSKGILLMTVEVDSRTGRIFAFPMETPTPSNLYGLRNFLGSVTYQSYLTPVQKESYL